MTRRVKDYVDIGEHVSLDELIARLVELKATLPEDCEAELRLRGDETFGRRLSISYFRLLTSEEAECEARYERSLQEAHLARLEEEVRALRAGRRGKGELRAVA